MKMTHMTYKGSDSYIKEAKLLITLTIKDDRISI